MFAFILFLILGLTVFIPLQPGARTVAMVVFVVLMVVWLLQGLGAIPAMNLGGKW